MCSQVRGRPEFGYVCDEAPTRSNCRERVAISKVPEFSSCCPKYGYRAELGDLERAAALAHLRELASHRRLTLLNRDEAKRHQRGSRPRRLARQALTRGLSS